MICPFARGVDQCSLTIKVEDNGKSLCVKTGGYQWEKRLVQFDYDTCNPTAGTGACGTQDAPYVVEYDLEEGGTDNQGRLTPLLCLLLFARVTIFNLSCLQLRRRRKKKWSTSS